MNELKKLFIGVLSAIVILSMLTTTSETKNRTRTSTCMESGCNRTVTSGDKYCYAHKCSKTFCKNRKYKDGYCSSHYNESQREKNKNTTTKSSTTTKKKTSTYYPDCDDYDSYDDFMDDWDGYMPDGSDAEDYWENW